MKTLLASLLLVLSFTATATEVKVYSDTHNKWAEDVDIDSVKFTVNSGLGRAAVKFLLWDLSDDDAGDYDYMTEVVSGLYFDNATQNIMFKNVVCATTKTKRGIIGGTKRIINKTGNCSFKVVKERVRVDNGFRVKTKNKITLLMEVN